MQGEDDAARGPGPAKGIEGGVVVGDVGIAGVAEDGLDEVEVRGEGAGGEEAELHGPLLAPAVDAGAHGRPEVEGHEGAGLALLAGGEGQLEEVGRGREGGREEAGEGELGHGFLV